MTIYHPVDLCLERPLLLCGVLCYDQTVGSMNGIILFVVGKTMVPVVGYGKGV
ncbi:hypothetical protein BS47DRAFT_1354336 [Hydnum rufescens UP504]|uniref:Uncharacterized protein n=1 Tax=Hydnum rufescens UP504 TaxID=1448309 RepID=A0A9P6AG28_9AGAM|nr:hypothetical protein BS47DRAFT_1354336 [Hydnum rufescens UP504]